MLKYDDALDTFGVHGVGGTLGALLTGVFANADVNANLKTNLASSSATACGSSSSRPIGLTLALSVVGTAVIATSSRRSSACARAPRTRKPGLDYTDHGEAGYHGDEGGHGGLPDISLPALDAAPAIEARTSAAS